jgi:hypothetical protein
MASASASLQVAMARREAWRAAEAYRALVRAAASA